MPSDHVVVKCSLGCNLRRPLFRHHGFFFLARPCPTRRLGSSIVHTSVAFANPPVCGYEHMRVLLRLTEVQPTEQADCDFNRIAPVVGALTTTCVLNNNNDLSVVITTRAVSCSDATESRMGHESSAVDPIYD